MMSLQSYKQYLSKPRYVIPKRTASRWRNRKRTAGNVDYPARSTNVTKISDSQCAVAVNAASDVEPSDTEADERQHRSIPLELKDAGVEESITDSHVSSDILKITESSLEQNQLLLLALKAKHQLTSEALTDIMKVINVICEENVVATSKYLFEKQISDVKEVIRVCYICKNCGSNLESSVTSGICSVCDEVWTSKDCIEKGNFFFYIPLRHQLHNLLNDPAVHNSLLRIVCSETDVLSDIHDGVLYKRLIVDQGSQERLLDRLSLSFNCDGVPVFKSSSLSIWPVLCSLNELTPTERLKNILMWFGKCKPDMNVYLEPFVEECRSLWSNGIQWVDPLSGNDRLSKTYTTSAVCDSVARPLMQNMMQFNGYQGCGFCKNPGVTVSKGRGFVRVYPYRGESTLRNYIETVECAEQALDSQQPICGVKGPSVLYNIPKFDIVENFVPDYMHCVLLGVARQMMALWLDSQYHTERYYLAAHIDNLDFRLLSIKPPCNISRLPRSVTLRKYWKAHEWYAWLIFYSVPVLKGILPQKYFNHWCLLVEAVSIMVGESIFTNQLDYCSDVLVRFVVLLEKIYGVQHVSYNVHLLLHLVKSVKDWGPLWAHSAFLYESFNGCLLEMIKGTQGVPLQICKKFLIEKALPLHATEMAGTPKGELLNYIGTNRKIKFAEEIEGGAALGRSCQRVLKREHYLALHSFVNKVDPKIIATYYDRIVIGKEIVHTKLYRKAKKRNSYTVILKDSSFFSIETFVILDLGCGRKCYALVRFFQNRNFKICSDNALNIGLSHIFPVSPELGHLVAVDSCVIQQKCVFVHIPGQTVAFVCKQPNHFELCR